MICFFLCTMGLMKLAVLFALLAVVAASTDEGKTLRTSLDENTSNDSGDDDELSLRELKSLADDDDDDDDDDKLLLDILARDLENVPEVNEGEQKTLVKKGWKRRFRRAWRRAKRTGRRIIRRIIRRRPIPWTLGK